MGIIKNVFLKAGTVLLTSFFVCNFAFADDCSNEVADSIVEKKASEIAIIYKAKKVGIGHTVSLGKFRSTSIIILGGDGGSNGPVDRIGTINIDSTQCRYHSYLIGMYSTYEVR